MELPSPGTVVAGKYRLEALLGTGGMGAIYRARHQLMNTSVALKWLRPDMAKNREARERLLREAQWASRIRHPNVVQVFDVDTHDGMPFIVMELLEGDSLADLIARDTLTALQTLRLLLGALRGLAAAHDLGIVHRDIKPENIFVVRQRDEAVAKLLDFGVSKGHELDPQNMRLTQTGTAVGTPLYMPMEQLTASSDVDARADLYAFGVVLYHALSGQLPYQGDTFASVVLNIANAKPRTLKQLRPDLPAVLDRVVMKAMARRRDDRFPNALALIEALRTVADAMDEAPTVAFANTPTLDSLDALLRNDSRRKRRMGTAAAVLVAIAIALVVWSRKEPAPVHANPVPAPVVEPVREVTAQPAAVEVLPKLPSAEKPVVAPEPARSKPKTRHSAHAKEAPKVAPAPPIAPKKAPVGKSGGLLREDF